MQLINKNQQPVVLNRQNEKKKNKMISAYVNIDNYDLFTLINYELGESNNKIINQLIESWIKKHKNLL